MTRWFNNMALQGLLFHPEDRPADIIDISTGEPLFTEQECARLDAILGEMFDHFGNDVCETAYPIFMKTAGFHRMTQ